MTDAGRGVGYLVRGFGMWRRRPGLMVLGMIPALIVFVLLAAAFVALLVEIGPLVRALTPFADGWSGGVRGLLRVLLGVALVAGALYLFTAVYVGLTLAVGDPFYERIWRATEEMLGGPQPGDGPGIWTAIRDGLYLAAVGVAVGVGLLVLGFLPVVGTLLGAVVGLAVSGRFLAGELLGRPLEARGFDRHARGRLMGARRSLVWGFGASAQVFTLIPLGAVVMMPAAVVGSTLLARDLLGEPVRDLPPAPPVSPGYGGPR